MKRIVRKLVTQAAEILIVTYAASCALLFIPFAIVLSLGGFSVVPQTTAALKPLYYSVLAFIVFALVALVCAMVKKPKPDLGEANATR